MSSVNSIQEIDRIEGDFNRLMALSKLISKNNSYSEDEISSIYNLYTTILQNIKSEQKNLAKDIVATEIIKLKINASRFFFLHLETDICKGIIASLLSNPKFMRDYPLDYSQLILYNYLILEDYKTYDQVLRLQIQMCNSVAEKNLIVQSTTMLLIAQSNLARSRYLGGDRVIAQSNFQSIMQIMELTKKNIGMVNIKIDGKKFQDIYMENVILYILTHLDKPPEDLLNLAYQKLGDNKFPTDFQYLIVILHKLAGTQTSSKYFSPIAVEMDFSPVNAPKLTSLLISKDNVPDFNPEMIATSEAIFKRNTYIIYLIHHMGESKFFDIYDQFQNDMNAMEYTPALLSRIAKLFNIKFEKPIPIELTWLSDVNKDNLKVSLYRFMLEYIETRRRK